MAKWVDKLRGKQEYPPEVQAEIIRKSVKQAPVTKPEPPPMPAACPTCGVVLDPPPQRTRNCPDCGSKIVLRTDRATKEKRYLTTEGAVAFDKAKALASAKKKAIRRIEALGLTVADYETTEAELTKQFGTRPNPGDVYWRVANEQVMRLGDPRINGYEMQQIRSQMARHSKEEGRSAVHIQKLGHKERLWYEKASLADYAGDDGSPWRARVSANACCDVCEELDGRIYTFDQAIEEMPIPPDGCTRGWCNCGWGNVPPNED